MKRDILVVDVAGASIGELPDTEKGMIDRALRARTKSKARVVVPEARAVQPSQHSERMPVSSQHIAPDTAHELNELLEQEDDDGLPGSTRDREGGEGKRVRVRFVKNGTTHTWQGTFTRNGSVRWDHDDTVSEFPPSGAKVEELFVDAKDKHGDDDDGDDDTEFRWTVPATYKRQLDSTTVTHMMMLVRDGVEDMFRSLHNHEVKQTPVMQRAYDTLRSVLAAAKSGQVVLNSKEGKKLLYQHIKTIALAAASQSGRAQSVSMEVARREVTTSDIISGALAKTGIKPTFKAPGGGGKGRGARGLASITCFLCQEKGHKRENCPKKGNEARGAHTQQH
eukprot:PhM_4_TR8460/c5_g1_i6/m.47276